MTDYTLIFEFNGITGWIGYVRQLPDLRRVQGQQLQEVQHQLAGQLMGMLWETPGHHDICITSEVYYQLANSSQQLSDN